jgi:hypothetical protein
MIIPSPTKACYEPAVGDQPESDTPMSDGISDAYREMEEAKTFEEELKALATFLSNETPANRRALDKAVALADANRYVAYRHAPHLEARLAKLKAKDKREWALILTPLVKSGEHRDDYGAQLLALSPYKNCKLVVAFQGCGFANYSGDLAAIFGPAKTAAHKRRNVIRAKAGNTPCSPTGDYLIAISGDDKLKLHAEHLPR